MPRITDWKQRYTFRKTSDAVRVVVFAVVFFTIWIENVQALFVAYGLVGAGMAVALQDVAKNSVGGIQLMIHGLYRAGDRIEVAGIQGDVIDVGLQYTTLLEIQEWVKGDQTTGRLISIPNREVVMGAVRNYTRDNTVLWDELMVPLTYQSNWKKAVTELGKIVEDQTQEYIALAQEDIKALSSKYYLSTRDAAPGVYVAVTDNWVSLNIRYVVQVRKRREVHGLISAAVLEWIDSQSDVEIASETLQLLKSGD